MLKKKTGKITYKFAFVKVPTFSLCAFSHWIGAIQALFDALFVIVAFIDSEILLFY